MRRLYAGAIINTASIDNQPSSRESQSTIHQFWTILDLRHLPELFQSKTPLLTLSESYIDPSTILFPLQFNRPFAISLTQFTRKLNHFISEATTASTPIKPKTPSFRLYQRLHARLTAPSVYCQSVQQGHFDCQISYTRKGRELQTYRQDGLGHGLVVRLEVSQHPQALRPVPQHSGDAASSGRHQDRHH